MEVRQKRMRFIQSLCAKLELLCTRLEFIHIKSRVKENKEGEGNGGCSPPETEDEMHMNQF